MIPLPPSPWEVAEVLLEDVEVASERVDLAGSTLLRATQRHPELLPPGVEPRATRLPVAVWTRLALTVLAPRAALRQARGGIKPGPSEGYRDRQIGEGRLSLATAARTFDRHRDTLRMRALARGLSVADGLAVEVWRELAAAPVYRGRRAA